MTQMIYDDHGGEGGNVPPRLRPLLCDQQTARTYHSWGMNILGLKPRSKRPRYAWDRWQTQRQDWEQDLAWYEDWADGMSMVNGIGGWRSIDFDQAYDEQIIPFALSCLGLPEDYPWVVRSGSGYGFHIHVRCYADIPFDLSRGVVVGLPRYDEHIEEAPFKQMEIRWQSAQTVLPPTMHSSGERYQWYREAPAEPPPPIDPYFIEVLYYSLCQERREEVYGALPPREEDEREIASPEDLTQQQTFYVRKAMRNEIDSLRKAPEGQRNNTLNRVAFKLGMFVASNSLSSELYRSKLLDSAQAIGLDADESYRTIESALHASRQFPRKPPMDHLAVKEETRTPYQEVPLAPFPASGERGGTTVDDHLLTFTPDDAGNADAMHYLYGDQFLSTKTYGWLAWNGKYWEQDWGILVQRTIEMLRKRQATALHHGIELKCAVGSAAKVNGCDGLFESRVPTNIATFDNNPDLLNCHNGVLNLRTGELLPHHPSLRFTYCIPTAYTPSVSYDEWVEYLKTVVGGGMEVIEYLQICVGYSITGHISEESAFYIYGPTRSGKGTFSETWLATFGKILAKSADFATFTAKREGDTSNFDLAVLRPARIVIASESSKYQSLNPAKLKQMTGGDEIACAFKHKDTFTYRPQYTIWLLSNHPVNGDVDDNALWGRIHVIEFPHSFLGKEDRSIKYRMKEPEMLQMFLSWAVEGAQKWYALGNRGLVTPTYVQESGKNQRAAQNYVEQWIHECCELIPETWTANEIVIPSYTAWCKANNVEAKKNRSFADSLHALNLETVKGWNAFSKKTVRGVQGLKVLLREEGT